MKTTSLELELHVCTALYTVRIVHAHNRELLGSTRIEMAGWEGTLIHNTVPCAVGNGNCYCAKRPASINRIDRRRARRVKPIHLLET